MNAQQFALLALTIMALLGFLLIAAYFMTARSRSYLLYLGLAFCALGVLAISTVLMVRLLALAVFLAFFITAGISAIHDTKGRLQELRNQQVDREAAFAEFLQATVGKEEAENTAQPAPSDDNAAEPAEKA
ncbi:MAG: hypothetical protein ACYC7E_03360 [Armatimonadota bacterium]